MILDANKQLNKYRLELFLDMNSYLLPLWFRPGNRYEVTVYGCQYDGSRAEVVCEKSVDFRTGEGM